MLYVHKVKDNIIFMIMYVDDLIIRGDTMKHIEEAKKMLDKTFKMKEHYFLGI